LLFCYQRLYNGGMAESEWLKKHAPKWAALIAANVRAARDKAGMSQAALGKRAGMVASVITRLESGAHFPSLMSLLKVAEALGIEPAKLLKK
jgi:ribosome-binding protein aMBF1 (putative translation factor)